MAMIAMTANSSIRVKARAKRRVNIVWVCVTGRASLREPSLIFSDIIDILMMMKRSSLLLTKRASLKRDSDRRGVFDQARGGWAVRLCSEPDRMEKPPRSFHLDTSE
jgi:hypothetical protein